MINVISESNKKKGISQKQKELIHKRTKFIALYNDGVSISEIAHYFSCHKTTVKRWTNRFLEKKELIDKPSISIFLSSIGDAVYHDKCIG
ncbi:MAG: hypothetical protein OMM_08737 [Candidatus Magnetoglobus multicellularis str. Araruama]|uniref:Uncharacterized protein n=1 Tax=Candidatus Magnetoglobus multicellularis str. Araruama TaxID=890399 RepID=A0A1V1P6Y4_9BACT|nr:MAG: hypothetical protein OMM_08737 [Candidatus Magnetoglobus multicellularis str. Araruama]